MKSEELDRQLQVFGEEIKLDCHMDQLNVREKVGLLASIRHKWVARLIRAKRDILFFEREKKRLIAAAVQIAKDRKAPVEFSARAIAASCSNLPAIQAIDEQVANLEIIVLYLEKVEKVFQAMGHDARNLVDLIKLETT